MHTVARVASPSSRGDGTDGYSVFATTIVVGGIFGAAGLAFAPARFAWPDRDA